MELSHEERLRIIEKMIDTVEADVDQLHMETHEEQVKLERLHKEREELKRRMEG